MLRGEGGGGGGKVAGRCGGGLRPEPAVESTWYRPHLPMPLKAAVNMYYSYSTCARRRSEIGCTNWMLLMLLCDASGRRKRPRHADHEPP